MSFILFLTVRKKIVVAEKSQKYVTKDYREPCIYAFWHGTLLFAFRYIGRFRPNALLSKSGDGEILAGVLRHWGYSLIRGSSATDGRDAYEAAVAALRNGGSLAITPDGSRGPYRQAHSGAYRMAVETGAALIPVGVAFSNAWTLSSWDRFQIPKPFSKVVLTMGEPIAAPVELSKEKFSDLLTKETLRAEQMVINC